MARPTKKGMDYFPLDVTLSDEVEAVEALHGNDGFTVVIKTWQALYQTEDGSLDCSGVLRRKTLAKRANISEELWGIIIDTCVEAGLFDEESWSDHQIITSSGVVKRMVKVAEEREKGRERAEKRWKKSSSPKNDAENITKNDGSESERESERESNTPLPQEGGVLLNPGFSDDFMVSIWPAFVRNKKGRYKTLETQSIAIKQLFDKSGRSEEEAVQALRETLANGYQGFTWYFDKKNRPNSNGNGKQRKGDSADTWDAEFSDLENRLQGSWNPDC